MGRTEKRSVAADVCVRNIGQIIGEQVMYKVLYVACFNIVAYITRKFYKREAENLAVSFLITLLVYTVYINLRLLNS